MKTIVRDGKCVFVSEEEFEKYLVTKEYLEKEVEGLKQYFSDAFNFLKMMRSDGRGKEFEDKAVLLKTKESAKEFIEDTITIWIEDDLNFVEHITKHMLSYEKRCINNFIYILHFHQAFSQRVNSFLEKVLINHKDENKKAKRIGILLRIDRLFMTIADLCELGIEDIEALGNKDFIKVAKRVRNLCDNLGKKVIHDPIKQ